ncbi:MAG: hypothetical protein AAFS10_03360 [Myxococcota bacterium]
MQLTRETFEPLVGTIFEVGAANDTVVAVSLIEVKPLGQGLERESFSLLFRFPAQINWPQGIRSMRHPDLDTIEMFLVPVGPGKTGVLYEAVFT